MGWFLKVLINKDIWGRRSAQSVVSCENLSKSYGTGAGVGAGVNSENQVNQVVLFASAVTYQALQYYWLNQVLGETGDCDFVQCFKIFCPPFVENYSKFSEKNI